MIAEDYITEWCDKTYKGGKELGDWTTAEVMKFANDFHQHASNPNEGSYEHLKTGGTYEVVSFDVVNKTTDEPMVLYVDVNKRKKYVRTFKDFAEKFIKLNR